MKRTSDSKEESLDLEKKLFNIKILQGRNEFDGMKALIKSSLHCSNAFYMNSIY